MTDKIQHFWQEYLSTLAPDHPHHHMTYEAWAFGDTKRMANVLGLLVRDGPKRATTASLWACEVENFPLPEVGDLSIVLDGQGDPLCIIECREILIKPFNEVDAEFAFDEGEGDRSLAYWQEAHRDFFMRSLPVLGLEFAEDMPVVCERFELLYPPKP
ncbi:ASCH domain-containing protein [Anaerolineales bacterium]